MQILIWKDKKQIPNSKYKYKLFKCKDKEKIPNRHVVTEIPRTEEAASALEKVRRKVPKRGILWDFADGYKIHIFI